MQGEILKEILKDILNKILRVILLKKKGKLIMK